MQHQCVTYHMITEISLSLFIITAIFPGGSGLAGTRMSPFCILLELMMMEVVVITGAIRRAEPQQDRHHQQTNTHFSYRLDARPVTQPK